MVLNRFILIKNRQFRTNKSILISIATQTAVFNRKKTGKLYKAKKNNKAIKNRKKNLKEQSLSNLLFRMRYLIINLQTQNNKMNMHLHFMKTNNNLLSNINWNKSLIMIKFKKIKEGSNYMRQLIT